MTPHIEANKGDYSEIVLMPGDPVRAKFIADKFLDNVQLVNKVRNCYGFTGFYKGLRISIQASGMGQPSLGIYATELFDLYDVKKIFRIGTCGAFQPEVNVGDLIVPLSASTDSNMSNALFEGIHISPVCSYKLLDNFLKIAIATSHVIHVGSFFSTDSFYALDKNWWLSYRDAGILGVDMESNYLYSLAMKRGLEALAVNLVSDSFANNNKLTSKERVCLIEDATRVLLDSILIYS